MTCVQVKSMLSAYLDGAITGRQMYSLDQHLQNCSACDQQYESLVRTQALLSNVVLSGRRSTAFGIFDTGFGVPWFVGSAIMGLLYDRSIPSLVAFSVTMQLLALPVFVFGKKSET